MKGNIKMKVTEICGYLTNHTGLFGRYFAYYHTKIEGRNVILLRLLEPNREVRGPSVFEKLEDSIYAIRDLR